MIKLPGAASSEGEKSLHKISPFDLPSIQQKGTFFTLENQFAKSVSLGDVIDPDHQINLNRY